MQGAGKDGVKALVEAKGLVQISDPAALQAIIDTVLAANPTQLEQYLGGKTKLQGFFVGYAQLRPSQQVCRHVNSGASLRLQAVGNAGTAPLRNISECMQGLWSFHGRNVPLQAPIRICSKLMACWNAAHCAERRQVMKESNGRANPGELNRRLMETLNAKQ